MNICTCEACNPKLFEDQTSETQLELGICLHAPDKDHEDELVGETKVLSPEAELAIATIMKSLDRL